jgi:hypothetical protein
VPLLEQDLEDVNRRRNNKMAKEKDYKCSTKYYAGNQRCGDIHPQHYAKQQGNINSVSNVVKYTLHYEL